MNWLQRHPDDLAEQSNPAEARDAVRQVNTLDVEQAQTLDIVLGDWVNMALSRRADREAVVELQSLAQIAQRRVAENLATQPYAVRWQTYFDLLESRRQSILAMEAADLPVLRQEPEILAALGSTKKLTQRDLAEMLSLTPGRVSQLMRAMEARGQIQRVKRGRENFVSLAVDTLVGAGVRPGSSSLRPPAPANGNRPIRLLDTVFGLRPAA